MRTPAIPLLLAVAVAAPALLSGCLECHPTLDVRNCRDPAGCGQRPGDPVAPWDDGLARWPGLAELAGTLPRGEHGHAEWNETLRRGFWGSWGLDPDAPSNQVFLTRGEDVIRVRVLRC